MATRAVATDQFFRRDECVVESVVDLSRGDLVRVFQVGGEGLEAHRFVREIDSLRKQVSFDEPLDSGFRLDQVDARAVSIETLDFAIGIYEAGRLVELHDRLSLQPLHERYVERVLRESGRCSVTDGSSSASAGEIAEGLRAFPNNSVKLGGGRDGTAAMSSVDFKGDAASFARKGLRALEDVGEVSFLAVPDALNRPKPRPRFVPLPQPDTDPCLPCPFEEEVLATAVEPNPFDDLPSMSLEQLHDIQAAMISQCELLRDRVAILDAPEASSTVVASHEVRSWRSNYDSSFAALYHPWLEVLDPVPSADRATRGVPPSGHVAGLYARTDLAEGPHKAPGNEGLRWVQGTSLHIDDREQGLLNPLGINCVRAFPGRGIRVYGARTMSSDTLWRYVPVRRLLLVIQKALRQSMAWAVFEPNDFALRQTIRLAISGYLRGLWQRGALAGSTAEEAFFVVCDGSNNLAESADLGRLTVDVGVAPAIPAEFVIIRVGRTDDSFEVQEVGST